MLLFLQSSYYLVQTAKACAAVLTNIEVRHHCHDCVYPKIQRKNYSKVLQNKCAKEKVLKAWNLTFNKNCLKWFAKFMIFFFMFFTHPVIFGETKNSIVTRWSLFNSLCDSPQICSNFLSFHYSIIL